MIERIIEASVKNRFLVIIFTIMIALGGIYTMLNISVDAIPDLSDVQVIILTEYPGQAPQLVEDQVTYPLTSSMLAVPFAKAVRGYSFLPPSLSICLWAFSIITIAASTITPMAMAIPPRDMMFALIPW